MKRKKAAIHTLGCKVNAYESDAMQQILEEHGYEIVPFAPGADVYLINTCTVTNIADRKSRQMLHKAKKMNPDAIVVAVGCYAQASGEELQTDEAVDLVIGNNRKGEIAEILERWEFAHMQEKSRIQETAHTSEKLLIQKITCISETADMRETEQTLEMRREQQKVLSEKNSQETGEKSELWETAQMERGECGAVYLTDLAHEKTYEPLSISRTAEHTRAYIKVQDGCNQFCSYCMIPYARGRVRSRELQDVTEEVGRLAKAGYQEIVLTGIHLSSWGIDLPGGDRLLQLIEAVHEIEGIRRIRLGSLEPGIITEEFARTASAMDKFCPHFHLSLQSGCNATLKRMNRRYTAEEYEEKCLLLREVFPRPALTTDVIVGFPQESEEEFEITRAFLEEVKFYETHIFKYSRRKGTRAASMDGQIPEEVKTQRSHILLALNETNRRAFQKSFIGSPVEVLFEEKTEKDGAFFYQGHSREYLKVSVPDRGIDLRGKICDCILQESDVE